MIETESMVLFWKPPDVCSQWTDSAFAVEGRAYTCAEQFMMAEKARLFGDEDACERILATRSPRKQKALGQRVSPFDQATWEAERLGIVVRGNLAKFSQNPEMLAELLATGEKILVEASPLDRIWGVGLSADDERIHDRERWRGSNLLGEALMQVRAELRNARRAP